MKTLNNMNNKSNHNNKSMTMREFVNKLLLSVNKKCLMKRVAKLKN